MRVASKRQTRLLLMLFAALLLLKINADWVAASAYDNPEEIRSVHTLTGDIRWHHNFHSKFLPTDRDLIVYLPPGYHGDNTQRYPVLYLQDGQNIFDEATCFTPGSERHFDERAQELITKGEIQPLIIVGIYSTELDRITEYTPTKPVGSYRGGDADLYGRMLVEEVKPFIDFTYRTLPSSANTALGGSSLGGLVSVYLATKYPDTFGKMAATSPAAYWDDAMIVRYVRGLDVATHQKIFLSVGAGEYSVFVASARALHEALRRKGWKDGVDLAYFEPVVSEHRPGAWTTGIDLQLQFLFPPKSSNSSR